MAAPWAKMACNLDRHPRIRKAGRNGREVFLFVLRRNADLDAGGRVPVENLDPDYLASELMMTTAEATEGYARLLEVGLLVADEGSVQIAGWDDAWGKRPLTDAERKAAQRARGKKAVTPASEVVTTESRTDRDMSRAESDCPESPRSEEIRGDQRRGDKTPEHAPARDPSASLDAHIRTNHAAWRYGYDRMAAAKHDMVRDPTPHWPPNPVGGPANELSARLREVLAETTPADYERALARIRLRVDIAEAECRRDRKLQWLAPTKVWDSKQFWTALSEHTPETAARARNGSNPSGAKAVGRVEPMPASEYPKGDIPL